MNNLGLWGKEFQMSIVNISNKDEYSRTPLNAYPLVDSPGYELWAVMRYEGANFFGVKYGFGSRQCYALRGLCIMRGMR